MKRVIAAAALTIAGLAAVLGFKTREAPPTASGNTTSTTAPPTTTTRGTSSTTTQGTSTTPAVAQVEGPTIQTRYGPVQVAAVVSGGELVEVIARQLPGGDRNSEAISAFAEPRLREMALAAQSAHIDVVSGATFTSLAYAESLQAALDAAGI